MVVLSFYVPDGWTATEMELFMSSISTIYNIQLALSEPRLISSYSIFMSEVLARKTSDYIHPYPSKIFFQYDIERIVYDTEVIRINYIHVSSPSEIKFLIQRNDEQVRRLIKMAEEARNPEYLDSDIPNKRPDIQDIVDSENRLEHIINNDKDFGMDVMRERFGENASEAYNTQKREVAILSSIRRKKKWTVT